MKKKIKVFFLKKISLGTSLILRFKKMVPIAFNGTSLATLFNALLCLRLYNDISHTYHYVQLFASSAFKANILMWSNELK